MGKKKDKKSAKKSLKQLKKLTKDSGKVKSKCCSKYKKGESKRCKKCPCFDLLKKVA